MNIKAAGKNLLRSTRKKSPTLLVIGGALLFVGTVVEIHKKSPEVHLKLEEARKAKETTETQIYDDTQIDVIDQPGLTAVEKIKIVAPVYWRAFVMGGLSMACFLCSNRIYVKRNAALAAAYSISEAKRLEYMKKTKEILGEKKEQEIRDEIARDNFMNKPIDTTVLNSTPMGETLCFDTMSGRYFNCALDRVRQVENEMNKRLFVEMYISLNDFYEALGLQGVKLGDELGWHINDGMLNIDISYQNDANGIHCAILNYDISPRYGTPWLV